MTISAKPWKKGNPPKRILVIRLQAMGDVIITLPYLQNLRNTLPPDTIINFLTRTEVMEIPSRLDLFNEVLAIGGKRNFKKQLIYALLLLPKLIVKRYDAVIDLQNNRLSRIVRKSIMPQAWVEFDRYSPLTAGARNANTIAALGLGIVIAEGNFRLKRTTGIQNLLFKKGFRKKNKIVVLNPAGAFENRNWPMDNYVAFAKLWLKKYPETQFVILGIDKIAAKARFLEEQLGSTLINLVGLTTPVQAFELIQQASFVLSEDSGLMHMAWVSGIPTLAMFGSTRSDWSRPLGNHTAFVDSSDMPCGNCMLEVCKFTGDDRNLCMTRFTPAFIFEKALALLQTERSGQEPL